MLYLLKIYDSYSYIIKFIYNSQGSILGEILQITSIHSFFEHLEYIGDNLI